MTINAVNAAGVLNIQLCTPEGRSQNPCPCHTFTPHGSLLRTVVEFTLHHRINLIITSQGPRSMCSNPLRRRFNESRWQGAGRPFDRITRCVGIR